MNAPSSRCSVPGSTCRLLQLELPDPRPVWAALDAAGARRFTGELVLHLEPVVRVWFLAGEVYLAERETDPALAERLLAAGVLDEHQLAAGVVTAAGTTHLGRLFDRVPGLDRDEVELTVELQTAAVVGEIAHMTTPAVDVASYRHHPSGIHRWRQHPPSEHPAAASPAATPAAVHVAPSTISLSVIDEVAALAARAAEQAAALPTFRLRRDAVTAAAPELPTAVATGPSAEAVETVDPAEIADAVDVAEVTDVAEITEVVDAAEVTDVVDVAEEHQASQVVAASDSPGAIDLTRIIRTVSAEVAVEAEIDEIGAAFDVHLDLGGGLLGPALELVDEPAGIPDDVRAAVRLALAEIQAATRPLATDGLSVAGLLAAPPLDVSEASPAGLEISLPG